MCTVYRSDQYWRQFSFALYSFVEKKLLHNSVVATRSNARAGVIEAVSSVFSGLDG